MKWVGALLIFLLGLPGRLLDSLASLGHSSDKDSTAIPLSMRPLSRQEKELIQEQFIRLGNVQDRLSTGTSLPAASVVVVLDHEMCKLITSHLPEPSETLTISGLLLADCSVEQRDCKFYASLVMPGSQKGSGNEEG